MARCRPTQNSSRRWTHARVIEQAVHHHVTMWAIVQPWSVRRLKVVPYVSSTVSRDTDDERTAQGDNQRSDHYHRTPLNSLCSHWHRHNPSPTVSAQSATELPKHATHLQGVAVSR